MHRNTGWPHSAALKFMYRVDDVLRMSRNHRPLTHIHSVMVCAIGMPVDVCASMCAITCSQLALVAGRLIGGEAAYDGLE